MKKTLIIFAALIAILWYAPKAHASGFTYVASSTYVTSGSVTSATTTYNCTAGDLLVIAAPNGQHNATALTLTHSQASTLTLVTSTAQIGSLGPSAEWYIGSCTGGVDTFTETADFASNIAFIFEEYTPGGTLDGVSQTNNSSASSFSGSVNSTNSGELVTAFAQDLFFYSASGVSGSYTQRATSIIANNAGPYYWDNNNSTVGSNSISGTWSGSTSYQLIMATFQTSGSTPTSTAPLVDIMPICMD